MKKLKFTLISFMAVLLFLSCTRREKTFQEIINEKLELASTQYTNGKLIMANSDWWTSGFVPGTFWYLYENNMDTVFRSAAQNYTQRVEREKNNTNTHDLGFMLYCSFGNGYRLTGDTTYKSVLLTGARSLITRFNPKIGCIQSWNSDEKWQYPVIIDNMMNLEFLMWAFKESGDSSFYKIAVSHADTTLKNHFRKDFSSYHVVNYDTANGGVLNKQTAQGAADESAWARGQAWGLYGYTMMYRETKLQRYLNQAKGIANFILKHPNMPKDMVPYWDFDAPNIPNEPRDASSAAIICSALIELSSFVDLEQSNQYVNFAKQIILTLSSPEYLAETDTNGGFLLKHSVGNKPANTEVDVPLTYADYYYVEALIRMKELISHGQNF
jgi:hypothetical protein